MRVLVAVDLESEDAADFVQRATEWPVALGATVDLLFVNEAADAHPYVADPHLQQLMSRQYATYHDEMARKLTALLEGMPERNRGHAICVKGRAVPEIVGRVDGYEALVLGHRNLSALARLGLGMVGERVTRGCRHKNVILVPR